jgi:hypothetical protein
MSLRARVWLHVRQVQLGEKPADTSEELAKETGLLMEGFRTLCEGRYLEDDIDRECTWRYAVLKERLSKK